MKPFKGCVNENCSAYKKIHYRRDDHYCRKCGHPLYSVCADCWTVLGEDDTQRICASCQAKRTQRNAERVERAKHVGIAVAGVATGAKAMVNNIDSISKSAKKVASIGADVIKVIKK